MRHALPNGRVEQVPGGLQNVVGTLPGRTPAVVLEAARALRALPQRDPREVRFVLFDGEEAPAGCSDFLRCGIRGSRAYAGAHAHELEALVLADFVANRDLRLRRDLGSDAALWARLRAAAERAGVGAIVSSSRQGTVEDDHTPFMNAGVPAIDLIDFDFPEWHTLEDRPGVLSRRSLDAAGEAVVELMRDLRRR